MDEEPDLAEVVEAMERLRRNYRKPLPGKDRHPEFARPADQAEGERKAGTSGNRNALKRISDLADPAEL